jgi:hypothetical protein
MNTYKITKENKRKEEENISQIFKKEYPPKLRRK